MVHLMQTCERHEEYLHDDLTQCVKDTAYLRCLVLLQAFDIKQGLDDINLSSTYRDRIKHLDKASKRVIQ